MNFSVIIPVGPNDMSWKKLISDLECLDSNDECLFVSPTDIEKILIKESKKHNLNANVRWIYSPHGRAKQLNYGALVAKNKYLWFLHCDSRFSKQSFLQLENNIQQNPEGLFYFDLKFLDDGPKLMRISEFGVYFRSHVLKMPFGDQGFCLSKKNYRRLKGFDENAQYGEDHLFIWKAHKEKISLVCVKSSLFTSARKYKKNGWGSVTLKHLHLTFKQALPQLVDLIRNRYEEK